MWLTIRNSVDNVPAFVLLKYQVFVYNKVRTDDVWIGSKPRRAANPHIMNYALAVRPESPLPVQKREKRREHSE